jgi:hypothetical protein
MKVLVFSLLGAGAAVLYAIFGARLPLPVDAWPTWGRILLSYAAVGFVVGGVVGFVVSRLGGDGW